MDPESSGTRADRALSVGGAPIPGCAVVVVRRGEVEISCAGVRSITEPLPVTDDTVFHMASISKIITSLAVLKLVEEGAFALDDPMEAHVPGLEFRDRRGAGITVQHVLSHASGLPDNYVWSWPVVRDDDRAWEAVVDAASATPLRSGPGEDYAYSSIAFDLLAGLVADARSRPFEDVVTDSVLEPLGMLGTSLYKQTVEARLALPHMPHSFDWESFGIAPRLTPEPGDQPVVSPVFPYNRVRAAGGNVLASAQDVGRLLLAGLGNFSEVLAPRMWNAMSARWVSTGAEEPWYGLGLRISEDSYGHGGLDVGYRCGLKWYPATESGVAVLTNYFHGATKTMMRSALDERR